MADILKNGLCKLCNEREVGSQESHIIPKFFTKNLYFKNEKNMGMKTIMVKNKIMGEVEDKWLKDGLKQQYLFCGDCEKYFELLDTHFCNEIYYSLKKELIENVDLEFDNSVCNTTICERANETIIGLFVISLLLRCHISDLPFCKTFQLNKEEFDFLNKELNKLYSLKHSELMEKVKNKPIANLFFYLMFTYNTKSKNDNNIHFVEAQYRSNVGLYNLIVNEYIFFIYLKKEIQMFPKGLNANLENVQVNVLSKFEDFEVLQKNNFK